VSSLDTQNSFKTPPEGYVTIPISKDQKSVILKICVLVRLEPDPVAGHLVALRDTTDARVYLGCLVDSSNAVQEWLELWIQDGGRLAEATPAARQTLSNAILDDRWKQQFQAFDKVDGALMLKTGWESEHPLPTFLDLSERTPVHPAEAESGASWKPCTDEGLLQSKGLPGYGSSLHRYLHVPELGDGSPLVPATPGAPTNDSTKPMSEICGNPAIMIPLNPQAGLMLVKRHVPIGLEAFVDILTGKPWNGVRHGRSVLGLGQQTDALGKDQSVLGDQGWLFLEAQGRSGRLIETFHLKLRLLADMVSSVQSIIHRLRRPLLNISPESWQVALGEPGRGLPFLWTARAVLEDPGDAIPLAIEGSDYRYYVPARAGETSVYRPLVSSLPSRGRASVRIRQVLPDNRDTTVIEGTFGTQERIEMASHDLAWFRLGLAGGDISLYALRSAEGVPIADVAFEIIPLLSSPCDLYSLAVMAVRVLLVDNTNSLPVVLDEMLSLLRQIEADGDASTTLEQRISELWESDQRWHDALGPHHLTLDEMTPDEAFGLIPAELWWPALATILRMFPGPGSHSECKDYGDAPQGGLHRIFERTAEDLQSLILRTRGLIVADWKANQEVTTVIQKFLA